MRDSTGGYGAHLRIGGGADLGGLHGVLLDQTHWFGAVLGLKVGLRKPPRSLFVTLPQVLYAPVATIERKTRSSRFESRRGAVYQVALFYQTGDPGEASGAGNHEG